MVDLTWFTKRSMVDPADLLSDVHQYYFEVYGKHDIKCLVNNDMSYCLVIKHAKKINNGKSIYDGRTKGGKYLKRMSVDEINGEVKKIKLFESDFGIIELEEKKNVDITIQEHNHRLHQREQKQTRQLLPHYHQRIRRDCSANAR